MVVIYAKGPDGNPLWDYAVRRGWDDDVRVVSEPVEQLMRLVRAGRVGVVLANRLDGLARSVPGLVEVLRDFVAHKTVLIIPSLRIDTSKCPAKAFLDVLDAIEEFKDATATESVREGLIAARKRGVRLGRPQTVNAHRGDVARLRARGLTGRAIAKELGIPSSTAFKLIGQLKSC